MLYHIQKQRKQTSDTANLQLCIPLNLRQSVLVVHHDDLSHTATKNTYSLITKRFHWQGMYRDVHDYVQSCTICMQHKQKYTRDRALLGTASILQTIFRAWYIDLAGSYVRSKNNNMYLLICVNSFSKNIAAIPLPNITVHTIANAFFTNIICKYGCCLEVVSDLEAQFCGHLYNQLLQICRIKRITSTPQIHKTTRQAEVGIRIIQNMFAKYVHHEIDNEKYGSTSD